jgi:hypothetical protein
VRDAAARRGALAVARELAGEGLRWFTDLHRLRVFYLPSANSIDGADLTGDTGRAAALTLAEPLPLSELAAGVAAHPDWLRAGELQRARVRLKQGQQIFGIRRAGEVGAFAWLDGQGKSNQLQPLDLKGPVAIIHGLAPGPDPVANVDTEELAAELLRGMIRAPGSMQRQVWFVCAARNKNAQAAAVSAGFQLRYQLIHASVFGRVRHTWICKLSKKKLQTCPATSNSSESTGAQYGDPDNTGGCEV